MLISNLIFSNLKLTINYLYFSVTVLVQLVILYRYINIIISTIIENIKKAMDR
jgi:hypothetical protein